MGANVRTIYSFQIGLRSENPRTTTKSLASKSLKPWRRETRISWPSCRPPVGWRRSSIVRRSPDLYISCKVVWHRLSASDVFIVDDKQSTWRWSWTNNHEQQGEIVVLDACLCSVQIA